MMPVGDSHCHARLRRRLRILSDDDEMIESKIFRQNEQNGQRNERNLSEDPFFILCIRPAFCSFCPKKLAARREDFAAQYVQRLQRGEIALVVAVLQVV